MYKVFKNNNGTHKELAEFERKADAEKLLECYYNEWCREADAMNDAQHNERMVVAPPIAGTTSLSVYCFDGTTHLGTMFYEVYYNKFE